MLDKLIAKLTTADIAEKVLKYQVIKRKISICQKKILQAEKDWQEVCRKIRSEVSSIQQDCDHPVTTFYPDASGGNDSATCCDVCGMTLRK